MDGQRFRKLKIATWNVRGIAEKTEELQTELLKRKIDIAILTETCTENGQKQTAKTSTALQTKRTKERRTTEEEMGGPILPCGLRNRQHA
jgi:exonuclease III